MLELLFLLLPVAAAYGWYMGRRSAQQTKQDEANRLSRDYVAGVNFLLSNQQDKAVDLFLDMLKEDTGTVEAHLTLGNRFVLDSLKFTRDAPLAFRWPPGTDRTATVSFALPTPQCITPKKAAAVSSAFFRRK